jgi:hypothetical protein
MQKLQKHPIMNNLLKSLLVAVMALTASTMTAQNDRGDFRDDREGAENREQFIDKQARHMAIDMSLDDATTKKFIETFKKCQKEIWALRPDKKGKGPKCDKGDKGPRGEKADRPEPREPREDITEDMARQMIQDQFEQSQELLSIRQKYYAEYSKFLTQRQILQLYKSERNMQERMANHRRPDDGEAGPRPQQQRKDRKPRQEAQSYND